MRLENGESCDYRSATGSQVRAKVREYRCSGIEALCDGACYSFKVFGSRCACYPECGDEYKTKEGSGTMRHGITLHNNPRRYGHIPSNLSLLAATSMVSEQSGRGQRLRLGVVRTHSFTALPLTDLGRCLNETEQYSEDLCTWDLHTLFPLLFGILGTGVKGYMDTTKKVSR